MKHKLPRIASKFTAAVFAGLTLCLSCAGASAAQKTDDGMSLLPTMSVFGFVPSGGNTLRRDRQSDASLSCFESSVAYEFVSIQCDTVVTETDEEYEDYYKVVNEGSDGAVLLTYAVATAGGKIASKTVVSETVVTEPVNREIVVGTKRLPEQHGETAFILPNSGPITSGFGSRVLNGAYEKHSGVDISAPLGDDIAAGLSGTVVKSGYYGTYGNMVMLEHENGLESIYAHMSSICANVGDRVSQGDLIGKVGETGRAFGTHVHFEIRKDGTAVDPMDFVLSE